MSDYIDRRAILAGSAAVAAASLVPVMPNAASAVASSAVADLPVADLVPIGRCMAEWVSCPMARLNHYIGRPETLSELWQRLNIEKEALAAGKTPLEAKWLALAPLPRRIELTERQARIEAHNTITTAELSELVEEQQGYHDN
jgi:hypothetical protein